MSLVQLPGDMPGTALLLSVPFWLFGPSIEIARLTCLLAASLYSAVNLYLDKTNCFDASGAVCRCLLHDLPVLGLLLLDDFVGALVYTCPVGRYARDRPSDYVGSPRSLDSGRGALGGSGLGAANGMPIWGLASIALLGKARFSRLALMALVMVIVLSPWLIRNYFEMGHHILLATQGGEAFLGSNNPYVRDDPALRGEWLAPIAVPEYRDRLQPVQDEVERDRIQTQIAMEFLKNNVSNLPLLALRKLERWLTPVTRSGGRTRLLVLISYGSLLLGLGIGLLRGTIARSNLLILALSSTAASVVITVVHYGMLTRGRLPLEMIWLPWAAASAWELLASVHARFKGKMAQ